MTNNNIEQPRLPVHPTSAKAACAVGALKAIFKSLRFVEKPQNLMFGVCKLNLAGAGTLPL
jgi:hypothetical protein